ncbi:MAG: FliM/FliN family flagellar motor switch protein [Polyangiales bacterium]
MSAPPSPFPWSSLWRVSRREAARAREALRRLAPSAPRPDASLPSRWREILGGDCDAAPGVPRVAARLDATELSGFTAVLTRDDGAVVLACVDRRLARAAAARALSLGDLERPGDDAPITPAEEGALVALCARVSLLVCVPPARVRAVTDDVEDALRAMRAASPAGATLVWPWRVRTVDGEGVVTLALPPRREAPPRFAPRASVRRAEVTVLVIAARAAWPARELADLAPGDLLALDGLRVTRGALSGGVDLALGAHDGPSFSATLTPRGARLDADATPHGAPAMTVPTSPEAPASAMERAVLDAIPLEVTVEIARATATVGEVSSWRPGAVVEFATAVGDPAVIRAGGRPVARGELVEVEGCVGLRVTELL